MVCKSSELYGDWIYTSRRRQEVDTHSADFTYGMTHAYSRFVLMVYSAAVSRYVRPARFWSVVTPHPMEDITEPFKPMQKFGKVDSSGQTCMETQKNLCGVAQDVRSMGISIPETPCH